MPRVLVGASRSHRQAVLDCYRALPALSSSPFPDFRTVSRRILAFSLEGGRCPSESSHLLVLMSSASRQLRQVGKVNCSRLRELEPNGTGDKVEHAQGHQQVRLAVAARVRKYFAPLVAGHLCCATK